VSVTTRNRRRIPSESQHASGIQQVGRLLLNDLEHLNRILRTICCKCKTQNKNYHGVTIPNAPRSRWPNRDRDCCAIPQTNARDHHRHDRTLFPCPTNDHSLPSTAVVKSRTDADRILSGEDLRSRSRTLPLPQTGSRDFRWLKSLGRSSWTRVPRSR
jgi:hypothetical protein